MRRQRHGEDHAVGEEHAAGSRELRERVEEAADLWRRRLGDVDGDERDGEADGEAVDEAREEEDVHAGGPEHEEARKEVEQR